MKKTLIETTKLRRQPYSKEQSYTKRESARCEQAVEDQKRIFDELSKKLLPGHWKKFGAQLGLDNDVLAGLEKESHINKYGGELTILRMLERWERITKPESNKFVPLLVTALVAIQREDIIETIQTGYHGRRWHPLSELQKEMQETLRKLFRDLTLPRSLWLIKKWLPMEDLFVQLTMRNINNRGEENNETYVEEIFVETEDKLSRRILVEGHPAYGKTTLITKFLSDWSSGKKYIFDKFDLVFVIPLRNYKGSIENYVLKQCEWVKASQEEKLQAIQVIEDRVLFLLDGLDEASFEVKESLIPLIRGNEFQKATVLITCRTGCAQLQSKSNEIFETMKIKHLDDYSIWDKRVQIKGISFENRLEFLRKYLKVGKEELKPQISHINFELTDLYECPLFLLLLAVLIQEKDTRPIRNKTDLYKTIFNFVINRGVEKITDQKELFDIFDLQAESDKFGCRNLLINFGRLCLEKIKTGCSFFEKKELLSCSNKNVSEEIILKLGLLSKKIYFFGHEVKEQYEPIHKSFLQFWAAFYLVALNEVKNGIQELMSKFKIGPGNDQFLYPFLAGFLYSDAYKIFHALSPFKNLISVFSLISVCNEDNYYHYNVENILLEVPQTEKIINSLGNLSIVNWERVKYQEYLHDWYVSLLNKSQKKKERISLQIPEQLDVIKCLPNIKINSIRVNLEKNEFMIKRLNIQSRKLIIDIKNGIFIPSHLILKEIVSKVKAEKIWIIISYHGLNQNLIHKAKEVFLKFYRELIRFPFHYFYHLSLNNIPFSLLVLIYPYIEDLMKRKQFKNGIRIDFLNKINDSLRKRFSSFKDILFKRYYTSYDVNNGCLEIPSAFPSLTSTNQTEIQIFTLKGLLVRKNVDWEMLFKGLYVDEEIAFPVENCYCVDLRLQHPERISPKLWLKFYNSKEITCEIYFIVDLSGFYSLSKRMFETIYQLDLNINWLQDEKTFIYSFYLFNNIQEIYLLDSDHFKVLNKLSHVLPSLKMVYYCSPY